MTNIFAGVRSAAPLDYFLTTAGPAARPTQVLGWTYTGICLGVCLLIALLLLGAIFRRRAQDQKLPARDKDGLRLVIYASGLSTIVLFGMAIYAFVALRSVAAPASSGLVIAVTGYDWWWQADYGDFRTANEIHIPVGVPVRVKLGSADVIHAFWVPQLAGKTQMIPGVDTEQWLQADRPGIYRGQCTQFCGLQHAHMAFEVVAQDRAAFDTWRRDQARPATTAKLADDALASRGEQLFQARCAGCHAVRGTDSNGAQAPDLTHLDSRRLIAAGALTNTADHQLDWIRRAQQIKPDSLMPSMVLTANEAAALSAYLATLH